MLQVKELKVSVEGQPILQNLSLTVAPGEVVALMGPNGSGKSTLANTLAGHPFYMVTGGEVLFENKDVLVMSPEERAQAGIFLAFQYPASLPGVAVAQFLRMALNAQEKARGEHITGVAPFIRLLREKMKLLEIPLSFAERGVNDGFSGGEKKRLELLQMLVLKPKLVILDEIDSGLDIDALKIVARAIEHLQSEETAVILITHYQRILDYTKPDKVYVMKEGQITRSGDASLAIELEKTGYQTI